MSEDAELRRYVIEGDREKKLWVLRRLGRQETLASGASAEDVRDQAFERLKDFAPCSFKIMDGSRPEWRLEREQGGWQRARND